jgi:hypothetical protein
VCKGAARLHFLDDVLHSHSFENLKCKKTDADFPLGYLHRVNAGSAKAKSRFNINNELPRNPKISKDTNIQPESAMRSTLALFVLNYLFSKTFSFSFVYPTPCGTRIYDALSV